MASECYRTQRRVEFRDTDAAGIVHFSVFFSWMESAEHDFLRSLGLSVVSHDGETTISWPRAAARCDYRQAIRFEQVIDVELRVRRLGTKSVTYATRFLDGEQLLAEGEVTAVCCEIPEGGIREPLRPVPIEIPSDIRRKLQPFVVTE